MCGDVTYDTPPVGPISQIATTRTVPLLVPACAGQLQLRFNVQTSVGGYLSVALSHAGNGSAVNSFGRNTAQPLIGNFIAATAEWGHPTPTPAPKPPTTCTYEEPGGENCTGDYVPMTCEEAKRLSKQGCKAHSCHGTPAECQPDGMCASRNGTTGNTLCVLSGRPAPPPPAPVPLHSNLSMLSGMSIRLELEGRDFNLFSFVFECEDHDDV